MENRKLCALAISEDENSSSKFVLIELSVDVKQTQLFNIDSQDFEAVMKVECN